MKKYTIIPKTIENEASKIRKKIIMNKFIYIITKNVVKNKIKTFNCKSIMIQNFKI